MACKNPHSGEQLAADPQNLLSALCTQSSSGTPPRAPPSTSHAFGEDANLGYKFILFGFADTRNT